MTVIRLADQLRAAFLSASGHADGWEAVADKAVDLLRPRPLWQCSGCRYMTDQPVGRCKGYCFDASGKSCDAVPCPKCGAVHYLTGAISDAAREAFHREVSHAG